MTGYFLFEIFFSGQEQIIGALLTAMKVFCRHLRFELLDFTKKTEFHFKMMPISSTDVDFNLDNRTVYVICRENSQLEFELVDYFKDPIHNCRSPYVPRTEIDFINIAESIKRYFVKTKDHYDESIRFWTDYIRINETHFWSEIANTWWSQCRRAYLMSPNYSKFRSTVTIDGYSELRNMITAHTGCICVGKVISTL